MSMSEHEDLPGGRANPGLSNAERESIRGFNGPRLEWRRLFA